METRTLNIIRTIHAPREKVWNALTDPEIIKKWWGPKYFTAPTIKVDLREGGKYLYCMHGAAGPGMPEQDYWSTGEYKEVVPMEKLVMTDHFSDADGNIINAKEVGMPGEWPDEMLVTITLEDDGDATKLTIVHEGHPAEMADNATTGWNQSLDKLEEAVK